MALALDKPNVLILDEPDNDLDIDVLAVVEARSEKPEPKGSAAGLSAAEEHTIGRNLPWPSRGLESELGDDLRRQAELRRLNGCLPGRIGPAVPCHSPRAVSAHPHKEVGAR